VQAHDGVHDCYVVDVGNRLVVWVPIDGMSEQSLRPPLAAPAIAELADILSSPAQPLKAMSRDREQQMKVLLKDGSPQVLCALMRDLNAYIARKTPNANDAAVFEKVRSILLAEWQTARETSEAAAEIDALLRESLRRTLTEQAAHVEG